MGFLAAIASLVTIGRLNAFHTTYSTYTEIDTIAAGIIGVTALCGGVFKIWGLLPGSCLWGSVPLWSEKPEPAVFLPACGCSISNYNFCYPVYTESQEIGGVLKGNLTTKLSLSPVPELGSAGLPRKHFPGEKRKLWWPIWIRRKAKRQFL